MYMYLNVNFLFHIFVCYFDIFTFMGMLCIFNVFLRYKLYSGKDI